MIRVDMGYYEQSFEDSDLESYNFFTFDYFLKKTYRRVARSVLYTPM